jgi:cell wall-associated NlpC family hydrolase
MSCAPLKPLGPQASPALRTPQNVQKITGIDEWDKVLLPWLGTPYLYGGTTKKGTDCSGFTSSVYLEKEGMRLPRTSGDQFNSGKSINRNKLAATDLVFFGERGKVTHVGIYVGNGNFIHASTSAGVTITQLDNNYWKSRYMGARRYL